MAGAPFLASARIASRLIPRISFRRHDDGEDIKTLDEPVAQAEEEPVRSSRSLRNAFEQGGEVRMNAAQRPQAVAAAPAFVDTQWGTIDLKRREKTRADDTPTHGHVINLKRK